MRGAVRAVRGWQPGAALAGWKAMALPIRLVVPALLLALASVAGAQSQSQPDLRGFAILGFDQVRLGPNVRVPRGAVGATNGNGRLAVSARVQGAVVAPSVRVARGVRVGRLFCGTVSGGPFGRGVVGGPTVGGAPASSGCLQLTTPVVDPALLASVPVAPGTGDLKIPARTASAPVAPDARAARERRGRRLASSARRGCGRAVVGAPGQRSRAGRGAGAAGGGRAPRGREGDGRRRGGLAGRPPKPIRKSTPPPSSHRP